VYYDLEATGLEERVMNERSGQRMTTASWQRCLRGGLVPA
jgi:hypothetical protein